MKNDKINYERLVDNINNEIMFMTTKNYSFSKRLKTIQEMLKHDLSSSLTLYYKHISLKMIRSIDNFTKKLKEETVYALVVKALEYTSETSYRQKCVNAFTIIEYFYNPNKFDNLKQNWKALMKPDR